MISNKCFPITASVEDVADRYAVVCNEIGNYRLVLVSENSQTLPDLIAHCAAFREMLKTVTGGAQSFSELKCQIDAAAGLRNVTIDIEEIGFSFRPKNNLPAFQVQAFKFCSCIALSRAKTSPAGTLGRGSSIDF